MNAGQIAKLNCAGQGCADRDDCRRYVKRSVDRVITVDEREFPQYEWASFDIERMQKGNCSSFVQNTGVKGRAA